MHTVYVVCIIAVVLFLLAVIAVYTTAPTSDLPEYHGYSRFKVKRGVAMICNGDTNMTVDTYSRHHGLNIVYATTIDTTTIESLYSLGYRIIIINSDCDTYLHLNAQVSTDIILILARGLIKTNALCLDMSCMMAPSVFNDLRSLSLQRSPITHTPLTSAITDFDPVIWDCLTLSSSIIKYASSRLTPGSVVRLATTGLMGVTGPIYFTTDGQRVFSS